MKILSAKLTKYFLFIIISSFAVTLILPTVYAQDSDNDGLPDTQDADDINIDQDGDGIYDGYDVDINGDTTFDNGNMVDTDGDGIFDDADVDNVLAPGGVYWSTPVNADFETYVDGSLNTLGNGANDYVAPITEEVTSFETLFSLLNIRDFVTLQTAIASTDFDLVRFTDSGRTDTTDIYCLQEKAPYEGRGFFCIDFLADNEHHISIPHPIYDSYTDTQSAHVFRGMDTKYYSISTTHRCNSTVFSGCSGTTSVCGSSESFRISDQAHVVDSFFHNWGILVTNTDSDIYTVQLHGCGSGSCPTNGDAGDIVGSISAGTTTDLASTEVVNQIQADLQTAVTAATGATVYGCSVSGSTNLLCGSTNPLGRYINGVNSNISDACILTTGAVYTNSKFLHIEQNQDMRRYGDKTPDNISPDTLIGVLNTHLDNNGNSQPSNSDTDSDGIIDTFDTINNNIDSDGDGLPDDIDSASSNKDQDGDEIWDGIDVDTNGDSTNDNGLDTNSNGISDAFETDNDTDNVIDFEENQAYNGGDINNDSVLDSTQSEVSGIRNSATTNQFDYIGIDATDNCQTISNISSVSSSGVGITSSDYGFPLGMIDFTLNCASSGDSVNVTLYFETALSSTTDLSLRKNNGTTSNEVSGAALSIQNIGGTNVLVASYTITDGGVNDSDGIANGIIVDPVGIGEDQTTGGSSGGSSSSSNSGSGRGSQPSNAINTAFTNLITTDCVPNFSDLNASSENYEIIKKATCDGIVNGTSKNTFEPDREITRAEATKILSNKFNLEDFIQNNPSLLKSNKANFWTVDTQILIPLNFRAAPNVFSQRIGTIENKETVKEIGTSQNWLEINYNGQTGWGYNSLLKDPKNIDILEVENADTFYPDLPKNYVLDSFILTTSKLGVTKGYSNGNFEPDRPITPEEVNYLEQNLKAIGIIFDGNLNAEGATVSRVEFLEWLY